jgi:small-conductance mechanosensitive channel
MSTPPPRTPQHRVRLRRSRWLGPLLAGLLLVVLGAGVGRAIDPSAAGLTRSTAFVEVDGRRLFPVQASNDFSAAQRVEGLNARLREVVRSPAAVPLRVERRNNLPVVVVGEQALLTVTARDTPEWRTQEQQAEVWRDSLSEAIRTGRRERRPEVVRLRLLRSAGLLLAAALIHGLLGSARHRLQGGGRLRLLRAALGVTQVATWVATAALIADAFPLTRTWIGSLVHALGDSLTSPFLPLGERNYSVLDAIVLIGLFVALFRGVGLVQAILRTKVLRHTSIGLGGQETIAFLVRYGLLIVGALVLLQLWGLDLTSLALFAGVLGVGVGLGLQGITKNFVSGLVILFERPIQVGDFVEIGDLKGTVQRVNLRSTEVVTLDAISIIVPNSEFLESRVVNWSHGSSISRLRVPVGVAYGSDPQAVRAALTEAAADHPDLLRQPAPRVFFIGFGESSLNFELLVWIGQPMRQFDIISDLNFRIEAILRRRSISIPFPQRDLHLHGAALEVRLPDDLQGGLRRWLERLERRGPRQPPASSGDGR